MDIPRSHWAAHVLIADDHRDSADALALLLHLWGYEPFVAYDGLTALELALTQAPDAALLDISLPGMDGCELARRLRREPGTAKALLVAVTGHVLHEDHARCLAAGFDHVFVKPFDPDQLRALLATRS